MLSPLPSPKWNYENAAHLLNRAGFGGTPGEIEKLLKMGLDGAVNFLVDYEKLPATATPPSWAKDDPERFARTREFKKATEAERREMRKMEQQLQRTQVQELREWWLGQMASGERPLQEKMTLFWHGHFATSVQKVKSAYLMYLQNDIFRKHATGNWLELLTAASKDPAMLLWLDQAQSRKEHPNENFAREVMELFALGEGNYTEKDVTEAARALTGWTYDRAAQKFQNRPSIHDSGPKTIFGKTGDFNGDDVLKLIVAHPQSALFICRKVWVFLGSENPSEDLVKELASAFVKGGHNFKALLRVMLRSEEFYSEKVVRQQVKSPVQWLVSSSRMLGRELPPERISSNALRMLGQELFAPPNVKGWDGGIAWITTNNLLNRYNFASYLVLGENPLASAQLARKAGMRGKSARLRRITPVQVEKLFAEPALNSREKLVPELERRFIQGRLGSKSRKILEEYLASQGDLDQEDILQSIRLVMSTPEFQLC